MKRLLAVVTAGARVGTSTGDEKVAFETIPKAHSGRPKTVEYCVITPDMLETEPNYPLYVILMPKAKVVTFKKTEKIIGG